MTSAPVCPKCAAKKSGQISCCARGGAWFKNCGGVNDANFDHTWEEGIKACKVFASLLSGKAQPVVALHHEHNQTHLRVTRADPATAGVSVAATADCERSFALSKFIFFVNTLLVLLCMQM